MKKTFIISMAFSSILFSGTLSRVEITNMISKIKEERVGISLSKLDGTLNPFLMNKKKEVEEKKEEGIVTSIDTPMEVTYTVKAILNHAAFINQKWYKRGDTLGLYKVGYISSKSVTLESSNGNKTLVLKKKKKQFIKLNRGNR